MLCVGNSERDKETMIRSYCTLFDKNYLYQGVALYLSLVRHAGDFKLYALCMDSIAYAAIARMNCGNIIPIAVEEIMTAEVLSVRQRTTHGQFCWVCQPLICEHILAKFSVEMVTYLEADSMFFSNPEPLFTELATKSVSLVPHNYLSEFDNTASAGIFCVQFNAFRNDAAARAVLGYWKQCCFTYDKSRPLLYPGQTCLDDWPKRYACVKVIEHRGAGIAPWNVRGYRLGLEGTCPTVDGVPAVFYHYHQYGRLRNGAHELGFYPLNQEVIASFYRPYICEIRLAEEAVRKVDPGFHHRREYADVRTIKEALRVRSKRGAAEYVAALKRRVRGTYNVYKDEFFTC